MYNVYMYGRVATCMSASTGARREGSACATRSHRFSSCQVYLMVIKSFCKSQLPHKSVNLFFAITNMVHKLTDLEIDFWKMTL